MQCVPAAQDAAHGLVEVSWAALDAYGLHLDRLAHVLSAEERERAGRFHAERDRRRYIARRGTLRELLARHLGCTPQEVRFTQNRFGKLAVDAAVSFNTSHSRGVALYAIAHGREVGCDLQWRDPHYAVGEVAEHVFSPAELRTLRALPPSQQTIGFFNCWTRKEAFLKARGDGLSGRLDSFDVSLLPGEPAALLRGCDGWSVQSLEPMPGYQAAVVAQGNDWTLALRAVNANGGNPAPDT